MSLSRQHTTLSYYIQRNLPGDAEALSYLKQMWFVLWILKSSDILSTSMIIFLSMGWWHVPYWCCYNFKYMVRYRYLSCFEFEYNCTAYGFTCEHVLILVVHVKVVQTKATLWICSLLAARRRWMENNIRRACKQLWMTLFVMGAHGFPSLQGNISTNYWNWKRSLERAGFHLQRFFSDYLKRKYPSVVNSFRGR